MLITILSKMKTIIYNEKKKDKELCCETSSVEVLKFPIKLRSGIPHGPKLGPHIIFNDINDTTLFQM